MGAPFHRAQHRRRLELVTDRDGVVDLRVRGAPVRSTEGSLARAGAGQALTVLVPGGPVRTVGTYSSSWIRPSNVRLLIISRATSG